MPRYFITTSDHIHVEDEEGTLLPDKAALRALMRQALIAILGEGRNCAGVDEITAEAHDESGRCVMRAKASFVVADQ